MPVHEADAPDNFFGGFRTLDLYRVKPDFDPRVPAAGYVDNIPDRCSSRGGNDPHHFRMGRQGALFLRVKQTFGGKLRFNSSKVALSDFRHVPQGHQHIYVKLVDPVPFV